jgi:ferredoxin, 2Fe-2S
MPVVRVEPSGIELELLPGEAVAVGAWRLGYSWPTSCWGQAECMLCRTEVVDGDEHVLPPNDDELEALRLLLPRSARRPGVRLGCRLVVTADGVTVMKKGLVPSSE